MQQFDITGMSCAACSARVEKAVSGLPQVESCAVNLLTNSMSVEGKADAAEIIAAVSRAGYGAALKGAKKDNTPTETKKSIGTVKIRLISSLIILGILMYFSMGHMIGLPLPEFLSVNYVALGLIQLLLSALIMVINQRFFIIGFKGVINGAPNMDTLVALGSGTAFCWSTFILFKLSAAVASGDNVLAAELAHSFYFESAAMILTLITVGKMLEAYSKGKTTDALKALIKLQPKTANLIVDQQEITVDITEIKVGDIFIVRPGESIPADGVVIFGHSAVDEAALTGESIPTEKSINDKVSAATVNTSGVMHCKATRVGEDTTISQIIQMVSDLSATKAPIAKIADKVSGVFVPIVIVIALITVAIWLALGQTVGFALARGISVLVISCPCALGLATPVAIMVGSGKGAKNGILFKNATALQNMGSIKAVALDKTGTLTNGKPLVTDIIPAENITEQKLLKIAVALEQNSEHPLAKAVMEYANEKNITAEAVTDFEALPGHGLVARQGENILKGGNAEFIDKNLTDNVINSKLDELSRSGKTPMLFSENGKLMGIIAVADGLKKDSVEAVKELKNMGIRVVMLTGDNSGTAAAVSKQAGIDDFNASLLPADKVKIINSLRENSKVAMVGDGINDAPALTAADVGIAIGAGSDIAASAAQVVLVNNRLSDVAAAIKLSRATIKNIKENLFWAFIYNIIGIPLAAGVFIHTLGWELNPMFGAAAMSISSFCVVSNALRLNFVNIKKSLKQKKLIKEEENMKVILKIEGMMCPHCSGRVKEALEKIDGVTEALVSHESGIAEITTSKDIDKQILIGAVTAQGYKVI